jgi:AhpD family alkylhydroperoxidase
MSTTAIRPPARPSIGRGAPAAYRAMAAFDQAIDFDPALRDLVKVRASQVNGCAYCVDSHTRDALAARESPRRLYALAAWPESPLFTARERAALALTDAVTHIDRDGVPEDVYAAAQAEFDDAELAQLILAAVAINAWNRIAIAGHMTFDEPWPEELSG